MKLSKQKTSARTVEIPDFKGFSPDALRFLKSLERNNDREWFLPRKEKYEELLKLPMMAVVLELGAICKAFAPEVGFNPAYNVLRIYRDTRFSKDKTPYKTYVAATFPYGSLRKKTNSAGLYLHVEPGEVYIGGGLYQPTSLQLRKIRESILRNPDAFLAVINDNHFKKHFGKLAGEKLKTNPRGISAEHELIEYLRYKQFFVSTSLDEKAALRADFPKKVAQEFKAMMPLIRWIQKSQSMW